MLLNMEIKQTDPTHSFTAAWEWFSGKSWIRWFPTWPESPFLPPWALTSSQHRGLGKARFGCGGKEGLNPPSGGFTWGREDGNI